MFNINLRQATEIYNKYDVFIQVQETLWNSSLGLYFNFQVDTNTFNLHSSPTSFYPMLSGTATPAQVYKRDCNSENISQQLSEVRLQQ